MAKKGNYMLDRARKHESKSAGGVSQSLEGKSVIKTANQNPNSYKPYATGNGK